MDNTSNRIENADSARGRHLRHAVIFALNAAVAVGLVVGGVILIQKRAAAIPAPPATPPVAVDTFVLERATGYQVQRRFVGRVESTRQTDVAFEFGGTVSEVLVDEGDWVEQGEVIARLDTRVLRAERAQQVANRKTTESDLELAKLTLNRQRELQRKGVAADQVFDEARLALSRNTAAIQQVDAAILSIDIKIDKATVYAPFASRVGVRMIDEGATVASGVPVVSLFETGKTTVRVGLSPETLSSLAPNQTHRVTIGGRPYDAKLIARRPDMSVRTRTIEALFEIEAQPGNTPAFGQVVELEITQTIPASGFWLPVSALTEGQRGLWSVLYIESSPTASGEASLSVAREAIELLHTDGHRAYVQGRLSDGSLVIKSGRHRVVSGQRVRLAGVEG